MQKPSTLGNRRAARIRLAKGRLLNEAASKLAADVGLIVCEPTRSQITRALGAGPLAVGDLAATLAQNRSTISRHLRVLREAGLVRAHRRGRFVYYSLVPTAASSTAERTLELVAQAAS